jgi:ribosomal protein S1
MSDTCRNCGESGADLTALHNWEAVCRHCGQLVWLAPGDVVPCRVTHLKQYGIFVELGDGVTGLVHVSELAEQPVSDPRQVVAVGEVIRAKTLAIHLDERRIGLSLKRAAT